MSAPTSPRWRVESWDPAYGASAEDQTGAPRQTKLEVSLDVELAASGWRPLAPPSVGPGRWSSVLFVDGVRRIDAIGWLDERAGPDGTPAMGLLASYAAGVVRCRADGAKLLAAQVRRGLFTGAEGIGDLVTRMGSYRSVPVPIRAGGTAGSGPTPAQQLSEAMQAQMRALEASLAQFAAQSAPEGQPDGWAGPDSELLVVDGPLQRGSRLPGMLGYAKTHATLYLPAELNRLVGTLLPGQRTPLFALLDRAPRYSWYLKLPGGGAGWAGVVRVECAGELTVPAAVALAESSQPLLCRYASTEYKDARAPQNLYPIGGLERELRRRLGDQGLLHRAIRAAAR
ncbi:MAG TPA: hypothetical protein VGH89_07890 [Pseudonocardia sp.]